MLGWHDDLKTLRSKQKKLELDNGGDKDTLVNLESRQEMQRADVERMRERAEIEQAIAMLKKCRPVVAFKEHVVATKAMIAEKKDLDAEYAQLKEETEPVLRAVTAKEAYIEELNGARDDRKDAVDEASKVTLTKGKLIDDFDAKISEINGKIDAEKKSGASQRAEAQKAQQQINQFQRQLNDEAVEFDPEVFNESLVRRICLVCRYLKHPLMIETAREATSEASHGDACPRDQRPTHSPPGRTEPGTTGMTICRMQSLHERTYY